MQKLATCFFFVIALVSALARADYDVNDIKLKANETPAELKDVGIDEHLGEKLDLDLELIDENGSPVRLGDYFRKSEPVILSLVYYGCANLCNYHLNGLTDALKQIKEFPGKDFSIVTVSFDEKDTSAMSKGKKAAYLKQLNKPGAETAWHFLTASKANIDKIAKNVGFKFKWNENEKQWAHASAAILVTPEGKISRYLHGVFFEPKTLSLAITESSQFKISNIINTFVLYCFKYDPQKSRYVVAAATIMKGGGLIVMGILFFILSKFWIRQRRTFLNQGEG